MTLYIRILVTRLATVQDLSAGVNVFLPILPDDQTPKMDFCGGSLSNCTT